MQKMLVESVRNYANLRNEDRNKFLIFFNGYCEISDFVCSILFFALMGVTIFSFGFAEIAIIALQS